MSAAAENTVIFGLSNVHYAIINDESGTYGTPKKLPGAVSLSISREGSVDTFWADNSGYASFDASNAGYSGTLTIAHMPKDALVEILGYKETNGVTWEDANAPTKRFALLYEVSSNTKPERFAFYERAKKAYAVVVTGERRFYGCFVLKKGVIPPEDMSETGLP